MSGVLDLQKIADGHLFKFFLLGQSASNPRKTIQKPDVVPSILVVLPNFLVLFATTFLATYATTFNLKLSQTKSHMLAIGYLYTLNQVTAIVAATANAIYYRRLIRTIYEDFRSIEQLFENEFQSRIDFGPFQKFYRVKVVIIYMLLMLTWSCRWFITWRKGNFHRDSATMALMALVHLPTCHSLFFIGIFRQLLTFFNAQIKPMRASGAVNSKILVKDMRKYRRIHGRLWKCSGQINRYFGWSLLVQIFFYFY